MNTKHFNHIGNHMNTNRKLLLATASMLLTALGAPSARAASVLHMDINSITISAFDSTGTTPVAFTGDTFTGQLQFGTNPNSILDTDIDGNPADGFTGGYHRIHGRHPTGRRCARRWIGRRLPFKLEHCLIAIPMTSSPAGSGSTSRSASLPVFSQLGYELAGDTTGGMFRQQ